MKTTLDIDDSVLRKLKRLQVKEDKSILGRIVSGLLAQALKEDAAPDAVSPPSVDRQTDARSRRSFRRKFDAVHR